MNLATASWSPKDGATDLASSVIDLSNQTKEVDVGAIQTSYQEEYTMLVGREAEKIHLHLHRCDHSICGLNVARWRS
jgi:hypothetical protein